MVIDAHTGPAETNRVVLETLGRLSVRNRVLERLLALYRKGGHARRAYEEILDTAMEAVPSEASSLFLADVKGNLMIAVARGPLADTLSGLKLKKREGLAGACAADGQSIAVSDVTRDPRHATVVAKRFGFVTRSLLAVPILRDGKAIGVIELINRLGGDVFQRNDIDLVERIARTAADFIKPLRKKS